jgi:HJR/Mrr/RecB family endonuclease
MVNYVISRTEDGLKEWFWAELQQGRLRQGWGVSGLKLSDDNEEWCRRFIVRAREAWGERVTASAAESRYWILRPMLDLVPGDLIVVPKMPEWGSFSIVRAIGRYQFDEAPRDDPDDDDFRHVIPIDPHTIKSIRHRANPEAQTIASSFRAYQKAVNSVKKDAVQTAIQSLYDASDVTVHADIPALFNDISKHDGEQFFDGVMSRLRHIQPSVFEDVITEMVRRAGYEITRTRHHDQGGDADIVAMPVLTPLAEAFEIASPILIQVKHKHVIDHADIVAVEQLLKMRDTYPDATLVVVSSADKFTEACEQRAAEQGVRLISKRTLARLLLKYLI